MSENTRIGPDLREIPVEDDDDYGEEWYCTWCGGDGIQESDDPLWDGDGLIPCRCCSGTGLRKHQTIF